MMRVSRFSIAKTKIVDELETVIELLLQGEQKHRRKGLWNVVNRYRPGAKAEQMCVWLQGARRGAWRDFAGDIQGDAIDLVAFALKGSVDADSRMAAVEWAEDRWGLKQMDPARKRQLDAEAGARRKAAEAEDARRRDKAVTRARKAFYACSERIIGTPADLYLSSRKIEITAVPAIGRSLRFRSDCQYWMDEARPELPAMVSAMVDATGKIGACHYTFLRPDGSGKADVEKAKLMFPETTGLVIRLTNGDSGLPAEEAAAHGVLDIVALTEGIEDGLSAAIAHPKLRCWACGSLAGLLSVPDHAAAAGFIVFKDNDWGKPQAQRMFARAIARLKSFGKPVEVVPMPADWGKDVNDAIRSKW